MPQFRKKPVVIEAVQWTGDNEVDIFTMITNSERTHNIEIDQDRDEVRIKTLEGVMTANIGDWVIKGVQDELYPCKPDIFEATYEKVDE